MKFTLWHAVLIVIAIGIIVGVVFEPSHTIPLLIWTALVAVVFAAVEKLVRRG